MRRPLARRGSGAETTAQRATQGGGGIAGAAVGSFMVARAGGARGESTARACTTLGTAPTAVGTPATLPCRLSSLLRPRRLEPGCARRTSRSCVRSAPHARSDKATLPYTRSTHGRGPLQALLTLPSGRLRVLRAHVTIIVGVPAHQLGVNNRGHLRCAIPVLYLAA